MNEILFDPKSDPTMISGLQDMLRRGEVFQLECKRRGVKFLPKQIVNPLYAEVGLAYGAILRTQSADFFMIDQRN